MKVKRTIPKKLIPPEELAQTLTKHCQRWIFARGDLFHWVAVLDRFDETLENLVSTYQIDRIQHQEYSVQDKDKLMKVLTFTKMLIDNCVNRSIYNSYEYLNSLMLSSDLEVVELDLKVIYCFSYRFGGRNLSKNNSFNVNFTNLKVLSKLEPPNSKDKVFIDYQLLCQPLTSDKVALNWGSLFTFQYYRQPNDKEVVNEELMSVVGSTPEGTPTAASKKEKSPSGLVLIKKPKICHSEKTCTEIMDDLIFQYKIPQEYHFVLFHQIRATKEIYNFRSRLLLFSIKFIALTILCPSVETTLYHQSMEVLTREPNFLKNLAGLIHPSRPIPSNVRTSGIQLMDSLVRYRVKVTDTLSALNFSTYHGVSSFFLRSVIERIEVDCFSYYSDDYVEGIINLTTYIVSSQNGGNAIVSSGIIPLIVSLVEKNSKFDANIKLATKCVNLLDIILYSFPNVFSQFQGAEGVSTLVQEISRICTKSLNGGFKQSEEVESIPDSGSIDLNVKLYLKYLLKLILHLMQSSGTVDGLRNLIDTTLPSSLILFFQNLDLFGSSIYSQSISILASFINNEPTTLAILLEMEVPQILINSLLDKIPISNDVISVIFLGLGAICLNPTGLELVTSSRILQKSLEIFVNRDYLKMLQETEAPAALGAGFDEFIRHHPTTKEIVFSLIFEIFENLFSLASSVSSMDDLTNCVFLPAPTMEEESEVAIAESFSKTEFKEPFIPQLIEVISVFMEAFLQSESYKTKFIEMDGIQKLLRIYGLSTISYDFSSSIYSFSLFHLFKMLIEFKPEDILDKIFYQLKQHLDTLEPFFDYHGKDSFFLPAVYAKNINDTLHYQPIRQSLVSVHGLLSLMTDIYSSRSISAKLGEPFLNALCNSPSNMDAFTLLWKLYNHCTWEFHQFKRSLPANWLNKPKKELNTNPKPEESSTEPIMIPDPNDRRIKNMKSIKYVLTQIPTSFIPLTCKLSEMVGDGKRTVDEATTMKNTKIISCLVDLLENSLKWKPNNDSVGTWFDYITVILGHSHVLFFEELDAKQTAINIATLEHFVSFGLNNLINALNYAVENYREVDEKTWKMCINAFLGLALKFVELDLLRSLDFVHPNDSQFIIMLREKGMYIVMTVWKSELLYQLPHYSLLTILNAFKNLLFCPPNEGSTTGKTEPNAENLKKLIDIGFPENASRLALVATDNNIINTIIYLATNTDLVDNSGNFMCPSQKNQIEEFLSTFKMRMNPIFEVPIPDSVFEPLCSLLRSVYWNNFIELYNVIDSLQCTNTKLRILTNVAHEKQYFSVSLPFLASKIEYLISLSEPSTHSFIISVMDVILTNSQEISTDFLNLCLKWIDSAVMPHITSDTDIISLFKCLGIINKRFFNFVDITKYLGILELKTISNQATPSIFFLVAIMSHLFLKNDQTDYSLMSQLIEQRSLGKYDRIKNLCNGFEYAVRMNPPVFEKVCHEKYLKESKPSDLIKTEYCIQNEKKLISFLMNTIIGHRSNDIYRKINVIILTELFFSYESCVLLLLDDDLPTKSFLNIILKEMIPYSGLVGNSSELKEEADKHDYFQSFSAGFMLVVITGNIGVASKSSSSNEKIVSLRRVILDSFFKNFKDTFSANISTSFTLKTKYGTLQSYADLLYKFLTTKLTKDSCSSIIIFIAKYCTEKKIPTFLIQMLGDVDVNFPKCTLLINSLLKSIELLTRISNKINQIRNKSPAATMSSLDVAAGNDDEMNDTDFDDEFDDYESRSDYGDHSDNDYDLSQPSGHSDTEGNQNYGMIIDNEVYDTEEDFDDEDLTQDDDYNSDDNDTEIVIRPHTLAESSTDEDDEEPQMILDHDIDNNNGQGGEVDIVIEERFEDEDDMYYDEEEGQQSNDHGDNEPLDEEFEEEEEEYIVFDDEGDSLPSEDILEDDMFGSNTRTRFPVPWRNAVALPGHSSNGILRLDWRMPSIISNSNNSGSSISNISVGETPYSIPVLNTNPATILHPITMPSSSGTVSGIREGLGSLDIATSSIGRPSILQSITTSQASHVLDQLLSGGRPIRRQTGSNLSQGTVQGASQTAIDPLISLNVMPISYPQTRWIQISRILGDYDKSQVNHTIQKVINEIEQKKELITEVSTEQEEVEEEENESESENEEHQSEQDSSHQSSNIQEETIATQSDQPVDQPNANYVDNGIDISFLEAIPIDLRTEVLAQHFEERRHQVPPGASITINSDFLQSLSPDLRSAYLHESEREIRMNTNNQEFAPFIVGDLMNDSDVQRFHSTFQQIISQYENANHRDDDDDNSESYSENADGNHHTHSHSSANQKSFAIIHKNVELVIDTSHLESLLLTWYLSPSLTRRRYFFNIFKNSIENTQVRNQFIETLLNHFQFFIMGQPEKIFSSSDSKFPPADLMPSNSSLVIKTIEILTFLIETNDLVTKKLCEESEKLPYLLVPFSNIFDEFPTSNSNTPHKKKRKDSQPKINLHTKKTKVPLVLLLHLFVYVRSEESLVNVYLNFLSKVTTDMIQLKNVSLPDVSIEDIQLVGHITKLPIIPTAILDEFVNCIVEKHSGLISDSKFILSIFKNLSSIDKAKNDIVNQLFHISKYALVGNVLADLGDKRKLEPEYLNGSASYISKFLGVFKLIDSFYPSEKAENDVNILASIDYSEFDKIWKLMDEILSKASPTQSTEETSTIPSSVELPDSYLIANSVLPLIESFFLCTKWKGVAVESDELFCNFIEKYKKILNYLIKGSHSLLSTSFASLLKFSKIIDFDNKRTYFRGQLKKSILSNQSFTINMTVRRSYIFEDTFQKVMGYSGRDFRNGKLNIKFYQEDGVDAGGVTREFFSELSRQMFNPDYALFRTSALDRITYQPNRSSWVNPDHLHYFKFVGRIIGKAILDGRLLDCYFTRSFYKHILGIPIDYKDMEAVDPDIYKSLVWILENPIDSILDLTFSTEVDDFGKTRIVDLIPDGQNIPVTDENKVEYVRLISELKLTTTIQSQIKSFLEGFNEVIPATLINLFNEHELELLISGMPDIDVDDWRNNTVYEGYNSGSPQIQWFWRAVRSFDMEERAKLLQFTTGTSKVPLEGFSALQGSNGVQKFQIHRDFGSIDRLPSAHTCFNQLDLPLYEAYEALRKNLLIAINECATGFGFA